MQKSSDNFENHQDQLAENWSSDKLAGSWGLSMIYIYIFFLYIFVYYHHTQLLSREQAISSNNYYHKATKTV